MNQWLPTACNLCECNCGIEVQLGGEGGRHFTKIRGDKLHPGSQGYACEKPHRLDYYQNGRDRLRAPLRRRADGTFEEIDWDTAIREVVGRLAAIRDTHGGDKIFYYGGGGQGNHLPGAYAGATLGALGSVYRSNALAQEKTGEFWVNGKMLGCAARGDFEHCEVAFFLGKNPWQSHGVPRARVTLKEIASDSKRCLIVVDPRRSETADIADIHLAPRPGTDAWLVTAILAVLVQEDLADQEFLRAHTSGGDDVLPRFARVVVSEYCRKAGVAEDLVRKVARRLASASSVAFYEDLGIQMNRHSTLVSYLHRLLWALTGSFAKKGSMNAPMPFTPLTGSRNTRSGARASPVVGARIISGLVPCNVIPDEILTEHPGRYRAMIVESANPAHSLADSPRIREALRALELVVVVDVAMTETARLADYVLPVPTQFEKYEATFFNFEFPHNVFHLRRPLLPPPAGLLTEPEIHARLCEALGAIPDGIVAQLRAALDVGRAEFAGRFLELVAADPVLFRLAPVILYRALGPTLPNGAASASVLWAAAQLLAINAPDTLRRAGFAGEGAALGDALFDAILDSPAGLVFAVDDYEETWRRVRVADGKFNLSVPELFEELDGLAGEEPGNGDGRFPFVLSAGERRSFTANTIYRDPDWRKKDREGALRICPRDAERLGLADGGQARLTTKRGSALVRIEISDRMQPGHVSLPNGMGVSNLGADGKPTAGVGVAPNELTAGGDRDWLAGTPWHKFTPARIEAP